MTHGSFLPSHASTYLQVMAKVTVGDVSAPTIRQIPCPWLACPLRKNDFALAFGGSDTSNAGCTLSLTSLSPHPPLPLARHRNGRAIVERLGARRWKKLPRATRTTFSPGGHCKTQVSTPTKIFFVEQFADILIPSKWFYVLKKICFFQSNIFTTSFRKKQKVTLKTGTDGGERLFLISRVENVKHESVKEGVRKQ